MSVLNAPHFQDDNKAREYLEAIRWPNGPVCPHCGVVGDHYQLQGKAHRPGLWKCKDCRQQFSVTVGTVFERSKIPLSKWLQAVYLMVSSKKGISSHQLHRMLGVTYKSAWFMSHRIREAMRDGDLSPFGSGGGAVEVDETFIGNDRTIKPKHSKKGRGYHHKHKVLALVDRTTGKARSMVVDDLKATTLAPIVRENLAKEARLMTDEAAYYTIVGREFAEHGVVHHGNDEYVRGDIHTNTIEGYFSIFKRGMKGVYQHCGKHHLHRYLAEFDFRYNNRVALKIDDQQRAINALKRIEGKRLTYRGPDQQA
jgi:Transposase and inactivated derivatives